MKINIIDVGCRGGLIRPWRSKKHIDKIGFILGFDIDGITSLSKQLKNYNIDHSIIRKLVFNKNEVDMFCYNRGEVSSIFEIDEYLVQKYIMDVNSKYTKTARRLVNRKKQFMLDKIKKYEAVQLCDAIKDVNIDFDLLKIDTQGSEYQVIESAGDYIDKDIVAIHAELFFRPLYKDSFLFDDVNELLKKHNFILYKRLSKNSGWSDDFLYLRKDNNKKDKINLIKKVYSGKKI